MKQFKNVIIHSAIILAVLPNIVMGAALYQTVRNIMEGKNIHKKGA